ncbi:MAG TPA: hypothetical protein VIY54_12195 [Steroidobacteraceae bacterium]
MRRMAELEARRQTLLQSCDAQRVELAYRLEQIRPAAQISAWTRRGPTAAGRHSFTWIAGLVSLLMMLRRTRRLGRITWVTGAIALVSRAATILRLIVRARALYAGLRERR